MDFHFENCSVPKTCGGQNISFPFFIPGQQEPYCGFPGFQLSCIDGYPTLQLAGDEYLVHNISYQHQTLVVSNAALSNSNTSVCIPLVQNLTFPTDQYDLVENQKEIVLLYDCNSALVDDDESFSDEYKIGCFKQTLARRNSSSVLALPGDRQQLLANVSDKCGREVVVTPVEDYATNELDIEEVLKRGFKLKWLASDCSRCRNSGGKCGFDSESRHFLCFCPDRPHLVSCKGKG